MADNLTIKIGADARNFNNTLNKLKSKTKELEKSLATTAKISSVAFTGLAVAVGGAVKKFSDFERTFTSVQTLLDKSSFTTKTLSKGIDDLKNDVLKLGAASGESFENLNRGLFDLVSAGIPAEEATAALADAVNLATAGATDTATAVKALTAATSAYGKEAGSTSDIAEKFFTAQKFGITDVSRLATEFNKVAGLAKELGISFDEALAASTALTKNGAKPTAQAFTEFRAVLNSVILAQGKLKNESVEVAAALSLQNVEQKGIVGALEDLKIATDGDVVAIQKLLGSSEALSAALALTGSQAGSFAQILGELGDETARATAFQDALAVKNATTEKAFSRLSKSVEAIVIQLGERFAPLVNKLADGIGKLASKFNDLSDGQKDNIANFIKWGLAITGGVAALATILVGAIKVSAIIATLAGVFTTGGIAATGFWAAVTGPVGLAVAGIVGVTAAVVSLYNTLKAPELTGIEALNKKLDDLAKKREKLKDLDRIALLSGISKEQAAQRLAELDAEIAKLEELRKQKLKTASTSEAGGGVDGGAVDTTAADAAVAAELAQVKMLEDEKARIETAAADRKAEENLARSEKEKEKKAEDAIAAAEQLVERLENEKEIEDTFRELTAEEKLAFDEKEIEDLNNQILTKQEIENQNVVDGIKREAFRRNQYLKDEAKFGKTKAKALQVERKFQEVLEKDEVRGAINVATQLIQLQNSKNSTLKAIGKAAAISRIAVETAQGAISAYASLSGIPIVGPALGAAAAGALIVYGAERASNVRSAQRGGIVPNAIGGTRDRVPMMLEPDELVVPKGLAPDFIQSVGRPDNQQGGSSAESPLVMIGIEDDAVDFLTAKQRENTDLAIGAA